MDSRTRDPYRRVPPRAVLLSAGALAVPVLGTVTPGDVLGEQEPLLWLLALVPAFLLAYYRGWRGASLALAAGMAALALAHAGAQWLGHGLPDWPALLIVTAAFLASALGAGWTAELLHRRFLLAQEGSTDLTLIVDGSGSVRYASPSAKRMLGWEPGQLKDRRLVELMAPGSPLPSLSEVAGLATDGGLVRLSVLDDSGEVRVLEASVTDRRRERRIGGLVLRARDITERIRSEEQNRRLYRMQAIGQLARALAHDFNNVLTAIRGHAHILRDDFPGEIRVERSVVEILEATQRASTFVDQLLAFTRQQALRPRPVGLNELVRETEPRLQELLGKSVRVVCDLADPSPTAQIDPSQLRRILFILASRAAERMPGGGEFRLGTGRTRITEGAALRYPYPVIPGYYAVLTVMDSGPQLSEAARARIFEPFSTGVGEDATGLELSSVYGTVKQSGGYVWAENESGVETFRLCLPLAGEAEETPVLARGSGTGGRGMVLIAEDDAHVRAVVSRVLLNEGYYVLEASDGEEALRLAEHVGDRLDLVVADMVMPRLGGRELAQALKVAHPGLPILFMSGQPDLAPEPSADFGVEGAFIQKPFSPNEIASKLRALHNGDGT